ncbi:Eukaryotic translation initiation factor 4E type 2 [Geodia barretti]|uniref:Eukaryotic translation initiation factor 4E type 2 n=1 Tax=Geodia barretti TaxID=519541 RepID=A0AA35RRB3_GEOBA|nr:Eukaryotic translation initiation factor 4E type 2 [Geodia barretti]
MDQMGELEDLDVVLAKQKVLSAKDIADLPDPVASPGENKLEYAYSLWFTQRTRGSVSTSSSYEENIKFVGSFCTVEGFWAHYCYLARPCELPAHCDIHVFKKGVKPMWEDDANKSGGKWMIRLKKGISSRCWESLLLAILGEQFIVGDEICGVVISIRPTEDIISLWNRTASDNSITARIRDTMTRVMSLPIKTIMEYKAHDASLRDRSSYRNTDVFVR